MCKPEKDERCRKVARPSIERRLQDRIKDLVAA
jgi:hypothetical protein